MGVWDIVDLFDLQMS